MAKGTKKELSNNLAISNSLSGENINSNNDILDGNTLKALDLLFAKDQQTYDEFLSSFLYLTKGN